MEPISWNPICGERLMWHEMDGTVNRMRAFVRQELFPTATESGTLKEKIETYRTKIAVAMEMLMSLGKADGYEKVSQTLLTLTYDVYTSSWEFRVTFIFDPLIKCSVKSKNSEDLHIDEILKITEFY